jgi:protease-4
VSRSPRSRAAGFTPAALAASALLAVLAALGPSGAAAAGLPPYADASDPLATTPSTDDGSFGAWHNPAQWGVPERGFSDISWFDPSDEGRPIKDWALSFGRGLGVAVRRSSAGSDGGRAPLPDGLGSVTDWQIGLASGDGRRFGGLAYGFSGGGKGAWGRENYLAAGEILRPNRFVSTGLSGRWAPSSGATSGLLDLGIRPLGDPRLLLFADYAVRRGQEWTRGSVGGGVAVRPAPGLEAAVRFDDFERVRVNLGLTFLRFGARIAPRFDRGDHRGTWYSIRSNPPVRGFDVERRRRPGRTYLDLDLHGRAVYQSSRWFDDGALPLRDLTERIRFAKEDPTVGGVAIRLSGFQANISMLWELRQSLLALKASGKRVLIAADNLDQGTYYLACVADHLTIDPIGGLFIPGVQASRTYMKDLLGKLGIGFDEWRYFKYKSALETFSRTSFSDADREQFEALVRASYDELADGIAASGRTTRAAFDRLVNEEPYLSAPRLKELGWVDAIGRWEDVQEAAKARGGAKPVSYESVRARRWQPDETWGMPPTIALVYLIGDCAMDEGIRARTAAPAMRRLRESSDVAAVVLRVDSPGGDALASDLVAEETRRLREKGRPTLVSQGRVAGSGGYWISMDAEEIATGPFTITGSIGVIGGWVWNDGFGKKTGLASDHVQIGKSADLLGGIRVPLVGADLPERNLDEGERRLMKGVFEEMYGMFTTRVAAARGMEERRVRELGEGRIYDGKAAVANGLVDRVATLEETIEAAKRRAGIAPDRRVRIVEVPPRPLFRLPSFLTGARILLGGARNGGAAGPPRTYEAGALQRVLDRPGRPLLAMPASLLPLEEEPVR